MLQQQFFNNFSVPGPDVVHASNERGQDVGGDEVAVKRGVLAIEGAPGAVGHDVGGVPGVP